MNNKLDKEEMTALRKMQDKSREARELAKQKLQQYEKKKKFVWKFNIYNDIFLNHFHNTRNVLWKFSKNSEKTSHNILNFLMSTQMFIPNLSIFFYSHHI